MAVTRSAVWRDLPRIAALTRPTGQSLARVAVWLARQDMGVLVAEEGGQLVGCLRIQIVRLGRRTWSKRFKRRALRRSSSVVKPDSIIQPLHFAVIREMIMATRSHSSNAGAILVRGAGQWARDRRADSLQAATSLKNRQTHDFYAQLGFEPLQYYVQRPITEHERFAPGAVRVANNRDLPQLAGLVRAEVETQQRLASTFDLAPNVDWDEYVSSRLSRPDYAMLVAEQDGRLVGYVELRVLQPGWRNAGHQFKTLGHRFLSPARSQPRRSGVIEDLYTLPAWRGRGIATALVQRSFDWFHSRQVTRVQAAIWAQNDASRRFFDKLGFKTVRLMMCKKLVDG